MIKRIEPIFRANKAYVKGHKPVSSLNVRVIIEPSVYRLEEFDIVTKKIIKIKNVTAQMALKCATYITQKHPQNCNIEMLMKVFGTDFLC
jgi:hypothetical protein